MRDFFKPWRRKIGVVTLGLACVFAAWWVRSFSMLDQYYQPLQSSYIELCSVHGLLAWNTIVKSDAAVPFRPPRREHSSTNLRAGQVKINFIPLKKYFEQSEFTIESNVEVFDFSFGVVADGNCRMTLFIFPYWSIVIPLTLLSAYLLLSKPRPSAPKQTPEPAPLTGT